LHRRLTSPKNDAVHRPIEAVGLVKRFGEVVALDAVDLRVEPGEVHGLLGQNGAGKSTLLRCVFGLVRPDGGTVRVFGHQHHTDGPAVALRSVAGFVDRPHFYPYLTARKTLQLMAAADGLGAEGCIDEVLEQVGLGGTGGRRVAGWSTGMLQRLGLAVSLLRHPRLLILDEPTEGLDPSATRDLVALLRSLSADGMTILLSSHDMGEVDVLCDRATILHHGRVALTGRLDELREAAPLGQHRLVTSDDTAAAAASVGHAVRLSPHPRGGLTLEASGPALHDFVCDLGRQGVSVQLLEQEVAPLTSLFFALTGEGRPQPAVVG
jgi:ABC-2 type transport system ATP-binding protein